MRLFPKTSAVSFYFVHTGFQIFKNRLNEILSTTIGNNVDDYMDDDSLFSYYRNGDSPDFVVARICGKFCFED